MTNHQWVSSEHEKVVRINFYFPKLCRFSTRRDFHYSYSVSYISEHYVLEVPKGLKDTFACGSDKVGRSLESQKNKKKKSRKSSFREGPLLSLDPLLQAQLVAPSKSRTQIEMNDVGVIYTLPGFVVVTKEQSCFPLSPSASTASLLELSPLIH